MKKSVALAVAAAMSLSVAGTALANNPFSDVPQGHWAYDAIAQLEKDGLVTGYGDGTYRGDKAMSRYEMATLVAQLDDANGENSDMINQLKSEFATELYNLGVRVDKLEKNSSSIKFNGDARIRYQNGGGTAPLMSLKDSDQQKSHRFQQRVRINMNADVNENVKFLGRVKYENTSNRKDSIGPSAGGNDRSWSQDVWLDRAELVWNTGNFQGRFGRITPTLGQGLMWFGVNPADGALIGYKTGKWDIFGGVLDYRPTDPNHGDGAPGATASKNATVANIGYKVHDKVQVTAAYSNGHKSDTVEYPFELMSFGFNAKLGKDFKWTAEYIKNESDVAKDADQDTGYWTRLAYKNADMNKPGSYSVYAEYMDLEAYSIDSDTYGHVLDMSAGNGFGAPFGADGAKGYGIGVTYVAAKNVNLQFTMHDLESTTGNGDYNNIYQFSTNFRF